MKKSNKTLNRFKHVLTLVFALVLSLTIALGVKTHAKSSYTFDGKTIDTEAFGSELPTNDKVYLTRDFELKEDYVIPAGKLARIYMNGHNINLNGHQIRVAGTLCLYEDRTNPTFFSLDSTGKVIEGNSYVVNGGSITGATSDYAIVIDGSDANLYLRGANIYGNTAGGVKVNNGKLHFDSGSITCNTATTGAGVYVGTNGKIAMTGGVIEYNTATSSAAGVYQNGYIEVSKAATIRNNKLTSGTNSNLCIPSTNTSHKTITVAAGAFTGRIGVTSSLANGTDLTYHFGYNNNASGTNVSDYFFSDDSSKYIVSNGKTGNNQEATFTSTEPATHTHDSITFTKWTSATALPTSEGSYYLTKDVKLNDIYSVSSEITICLNGHSININGYYIDLKNSANLTIRDCSKEVHYYDVDSTGLGVVGGTNHKFTGGYIYGGRTNRVIYSIASTATFNMYGGALVGNSAGAVFIDRTGTGSLKFNFYNSYIVGNTTEKAAYKEGSAIYVGNNNGVLLSNVTIQYNKSYTTNGAIWTAGEVTTSSRVRVSRVTNITENRDVNGKICNFYVDRQRGHLIELAGYLNDSYDYSKIGVTSTSEDTYFTGKYDSYHALDEPSKFFFSDKGGFQITKGTYNNSLNGSQYTEAALSIGHKHGSTSFTNGISMLNLAATSTSERYFYFVGNVKLGSDWTVPTGARINICLNGYTLDLNGHSIIVPSSSKVRFYDCSNFKSKYYINTDGLAVVDDKNGTTSFNHSYIFDSQSLSSTPTTTNAFFKVTGGTLELEDVNVFGSYTNNSGNTSVNSAICVTNGTFTMTNGMIAGCKGNYGGAIHIIDPDYSTTPKAKATLTNVKLLDNTGSSGGAIYCYYGQLTMTDCYLINNKTTDNGGAVHTNVGAKAAISYTYFYNNESKYHGGGLYAYSSSDIDVTNCEFAYNKSNYRGGAIYTTSYLDLTSVTCVYNEAKDEGGAIYYSGSGCYLVVKTKLVLTDNKSSLAGGGMYIASNASIKDEIIIKNNTAKDEVSNLTFAESYFSENKNMYIDSQLTGNTSIGVNSTTSGKLTINYGEIHSTTDPSTYFVVDNESASVELKSSEVYYNAPHVHSFTYSASGATLKAKCSGCGEEATITLTADTVTYDGQKHGVTYDATAFAEFVGFTPTITVTYSGTNTTTAPKNAGTYTATAKTTINGTNYTFTKSFTIGKKTVTVSGVTGINKVYDGTTTATVNTNNVTFNGLVSGDTLSVTATGTFINKNVGSGKTVTITFGSLSGSSVNNYTLNKTSSQTSTTATISAKTVTVSGITANTKTYDGSTTATLYTGAISFNGKVSGDTLSITATGVFADANVGTGKTVTITLGSLSGTSASNYTLDKTNSQKTTTTSITAKTITVSGITASNKVYDGTTTATISSSSAVFSGKLSSDTLTITATGVFANKDAGSNKVVNITLGTLGGSSASNYTLDKTNSQKTTTATISAKTVTVSGITAKNKTYDRTTTAELIYTNVVFSGIIDGETLSVTATGNFDTYNAASNKTVAIANIQLTGDNASNYTLSASDSQKTTNATINKVKVTVSGIKANDKVYDGTTSVVFDYTDVVISNLVTGDSLTVTATGSFIDASYGTNKKVIIDNITLNGTNKDNYQFATNGKQTMTSANITKDVMNITVTSFNGTYDAESHSITITNAPTSATIKYSTNGVDYSTIKPQFINANTYTVYYLVECNNFETINDSVDVVISKKEVTVSGIKANDKEYDGNTAMALDLTNVVINGLIDGDDLTVSASGVIYGVTGKNAGNIKTVHITNLALIGEKKDNYELNTVYSQHETYANITKKALTISNIKALDKYYDGTTDVTLDLSEVVYDGKVGNDDLSITVDGSFIDSSYGENKVVNLANLLLTGDDANNYYLTDNSQTEALATIFKALMTCSVQGYTGVYDRETHSITITNVMEGATVTYSTSENGEFKGESISYTDAGTYVVFYKIEKDDYETISGSATITINKKEVTISNIKANDKIYDGTTNATLDLTSVSINGLVDGDDLRVTATGKFETKDAGANKKVEISDLAISNTTNYTISSASQTEATASITSKKIVITNIKVLDKDYDKTTDATIDYDNVILEGLVDGDKVTITAKASFVDGESGENKKVIIDDIKLDGVDKANYEIEFNQFEASANITKTKSKGSNGGAIAGIVIAIVVIIAGASVGAVMIIKKKGVKA